jgi:hypothetical protein
LINGTDTVGGQLKQRLDRRGRPTFSEDGFTGSTTAKQLSYENIVQGTVKVSGLFADTTVEAKEVVYIDGHSEFLGLIAMTAETTQETVATGSTVQFTLNAGALVWLDTGVSFSDSTVFATLVGSVGAVNGTGKYFIEPTTGVVTVWVGPAGTLSGGIEITYLYRDANFNPLNTYSVEYRRGCLYSSTAMQSTGEITYKAADILCRYDVAVPVPSNYDPKSNTIEVRTDTLNPLNSLVKTIWVKDNGLPTLESLAPYYSPLLTKLEFRFQ